MACSPWAVAFAAADNHTPAVACNLADKPRIPGVDTDSPVDNPAADSPADIDPAAEVDLSPARRKAGRASSRNWAAADSAGP